MGTTGDMAGVLGVGTVTGMTMVPHTATVPVPVVGTRLVTVRGTALITVAGTAMATAAQPVEAKVRATGMAAPRTHIRGNTNEQRHKKQVGEKWLR